MSDFRRKIFAAFAVVFLVATLILVTYAGRFVQNIAFDAMQERAIELVAKIQDSPNEEALVRNLKDQKPIFFFRVGLINDKRQILYDSHVKSLLGDEFSSEFEVNHPEVEQAFENGRALKDAYSELFDQHFSYFAQKFDFHGEPYVLRLAFPQKYIQELTQDVKIGFVFTTTFILLCFSVLTWLIINYLTKPIHQIIQAVKPYQEGKQTTIPHIQLNLDANDDFEKLASTLNSLSVKIQNQIDNLIYERNEKIVILESLVEGVIAVNENMVITYLNSTASKFLNLSKKYIGKSFDAAEQPLCFDLLKKCQLEHRMLTDFFETKHGVEKLYLNLIALPKRDKNGAILVIQDQSIQFRSIEMQKDFVANASHELKTPITVIQGFVETLAENRDLPSLTFHEITDKILHNCRRMTVLIKDLLTLADLEHFAPSKLADCNLQTLVETAVMNLHEAYPEALTSIHSLSDTPIRVHGDPNLLELAFTNLLENAAKYSQNPAEIDIILERTPDKITVSFVDKGIGIPEEDLERIFQRFYTVNKAHSRKLGGSGLGLSIVKTIIEKHGGKIHAQSKLGKGSRFIVQLPN